MTREQMKSVTQSMPCAVCEGVDGCSRGDAGLILCRRKSGPVPGFICLGRASGDEQWSQYRVDDPHANRNDSIRHQSHSFNGNGTWKARAIELQGCFTDECRTELAATLSLPETALSSMTIGLELNAARFVNGHTVQEPCFTFPETDGNGHVIGIGRRFRDHGKAFIPGGHRGLILPDGWRDRVGPILLVEGPSDTLAATALNLPAIGRPSNTGGIEHLKAALEFIPENRDIIVVGEIDPNPKTGQWPGRDGAKMTAEKLATALGRPVYWALPPDGVKDVRAWTSLQNLGRECLDAWHDAGAKFLSWISTNKHLAKVETAQPAIYQFAPIDSTTFANTDFGLAWIVRGLMAQLQPAVIGAPKKNLKTSVMIDFCISVATGMAFLGSFHVPAPLRVCFLSGESGQFTIQETAKRICHMKGIDLATVDVLWGFRLPQLANLADMGALADGLAANQVKVVVIDPLYLSLLAGDQGGLSAASMFDMGPLFLNISRTCLDRGCTPVLVHHFRQSRGANYEEPQLEDLAFAGIQEFARQWLLLGRREKYQPGTGQHRLWLSAGGSIGHGGLWALDIEEGQQGHDFTGRIWDVSVRTATEERVAAKDAKSGERKQQDDAERQAQELAVMAALDRLDQDRCGIPKKELELASGLSERKFAATVSRLLGSLLELVQVAKVTGNGAKTKCAGYRRKPE